jgi:hypothetical protein
MHTDNAARRRGHLRSISRLGGLVALAVIAVLAIGACGASMSTVPLSDQDRQGYPAPAATSGQASELDGGGTYDKNSYANPTTPSQASTTDQTLIIKTGSLSLEVSNVDNALAQAQVIIKGMGGYVAESERYGEGDNLTATVTYRIPVEHWDDALSALHELGNRVISERTGTSDVTSQVVDLDARLTNLRATEAALQGIMAKASAIPDILAVQQQLTQTRSEIEQLTAQRDSLKNQAAMSTLSVSYQLPAKTVTTQATEEWNLGDQVDQAVAQLVKIGQGLATASVWAVIVGLPILLGLLIALLILRLFARLAGRYVQPGGGPGAS